MLIQVPQKTIWRRDPGVQTMVDTLNRPKYLKIVAEEGRDAALSVLSNNEFQAVKQEMILCQNKFEYAARNYFWIINKEREDVLLKLRESQELILEEMRKLKNKGRAQRLMILKARQLGACLDPDTRVLTHDLKWIKLDEVHPGQELVAVDEFPPGGRGTGRKMKTTTVLAKKELIAPTYRITMEDGRVLIATGDHRFLCKRRGGVEAVWMAVAGTHKSGGRRNMTPLRPGDQIRHVTTPWEEKTAHEDGWFGGMLDGEGSFRIRQDAGGAEACVAQVSGPVLDRAEKYLKERDYTYHVDSDERKNSEGSSKLGERNVYKLCVNRMDELFRLIGQTRPTRFIGRRWWESRGLPGKRVGTTHGTIKTIEPLPPQRVIDLQTSDKTYIAEGFVSHNSTLIEALIAWTTMFFPNQTAIVVSRDSDHAAYLFGIMQHILDQMPWYLQPMVASRKFEEGLLFDNPDVSLRRDKPGLHSQITVQSATQYSGIGQGYTINAAHISEGADWNEEKARDTMEGDLDKAIPDRPNAFGIWESTAKGAGSYSHDLWLKNVELFEQGKFPKWTPVFLPWFFEKSQFIAPENGWIPEKQEIVLRERVSEEWVRCDNVECGQWRVAKLITGESIAMDTCPSCSAGTLQTFVLSEGQLCWHWNERINAEKDVQSQKTSKQENPTTAEEAWQISGVQVFPLDCQEFVIGCIKHPIAVGFLDPSDGVFHGPRKDKHNSTGEATGTECHQSWCKAEHKWDDNYLQIWEFPKSGAVYAVGVDVAEGLGGKADYSVAWVNRVSQVPGGTDVQVAMLRSNTIGPVELAKPVNQLGRWYNDGLMIIEWNKFDSLATWVANYYQYPNIYRWKHPDSVNQKSNKLHWNTQSNTKPRLWQWAVRGLRSGEWIVKSKEFYNEMVRFQKESYEDRSGSAATGFHDDICIAAMICYYGSHDSDFDPNLGEIRRLSDAGSGPASQAWTMICKRCGAQCGAANPEEVDRCSECGCKLFNGSQNTVVQGLIPPDFDKTMADMAKGGNPLAEEDFYAYDES